MALVRKGEGTVPLAVDQTNYTFELSRWTTLQIHCSTLSEYV